MTGREKSDGRRVPKGRRKAVPTELGASRARGGKATTVSQQVGQLKLFRGTADSPEGADGGVDAGRPVSATRAVPKPRTTTRHGLPAMTMEEVVSEENLRWAFQQVASNRGAPGPDRRSIDEVREHLGELWPVLSRELLEGSYQGVPQGGPLSPLLSNIVLDELDQELARRGHRFVRYADDCNVYVRSERSGERVMASVSRFIESRLRLKVNRTKSAVAKPGNRHFVGFSLRREPLDGEVTVGLSRRSKCRIDERIRELTPRTWGQSLRDCIARVNGYFRGWIAFFGIISGRTPLSALDAHTRRRLRAIALRHWARKRREGWRPRKPGRRSWWRLALVSPVTRVLTNARFTELGLISLEVEWRRHHRSVVAPAQLTLALG